MAGEMRERVARALAFSAGSKITGGGRHAATDEFAWGLDGVALEKYEEAHWREYVHAAGFAISAMREPTGDMKGAGAATCGVGEAAIGLPVTVLDGQPTKAWQAMIDEALSEPPPA